MSVDTGERISEAEHAVMEALWTRAPLTAAEVCEEVCDDRDWTLATVKTLLSRLVAKRAVTTEADGKRFLYSPKIARARDLGDIAVGKGFLRRKMRDQRRGAPAEQPIHQPPRFAAEIARAGDPGRIKESLAVRLSGHGVLGNQPRE